MDLKGLRKIANPQMDKAGFLPSSLQPFLPTLQQTQESHGGFVKTQIFLALTTSNSDSVDPE